MGNYAIKCKMSWNQAVVVNEMKNYKIVLRQLFSEFLGTLLYLALVLSAGIAHKSTDDNSKIILIAMANGLLIASIVTIFGHVSGGHINPAITLGVLVSKSITPLKAMCYILMQILGSIAGASIAYAVSSKITRGDLGVTNFNSNLTISQAIGLEFLMTFLLVAVVLSVTDNRRGARGLGSSPLAIGLSITACICACGPYTACLNPVKSLGPAVVMGFGKNHWVYWVGPMTGGLAAGVIYRFILSYHRSDFYVSPTPIRSQTGGMQMT